MRPIKRIFAKLRNKYYEHKYRKYHGVSKVLTLLKYFALKNSQPGVKMSPPYYNNEESLIHIAEIAVAAKRNIRAIYVGDSLGDFTRNDLTAVRPEGNYCRAGDTWRGFRDVLDVVGKILGTSGAANKTTTISTVFLGSGGNNALSFQDIRMQIPEMVSAFQTARRYFPKAKIVLIGFPPVYDLYANFCAPVIEEHMREMAKDDGNASVIDLNDFAGAFGIFPKIELSSDGVHFSEYGAFEFDERLLKELV